MGTAYFAGVTTVGRILAVVKEKILRSSDWAHLQLTTGTAATTLSAAAAAAATSISTPITIPVGSYIVIGNGAANPEVRLTTAVSGAGPFTVSFADALINAYASGAAVGVGTYVKATTTRGAQMVIDLADVAITTNRLQVGVYRTHDGTTGVDKVSKFITFNSITPATTTNLYVWVSSGKEHLYIALEGPRASETGAQNATHGSVRQVFALSDIVPYFGADTVPAVFMICHDTQSSSDQTPWGYTSRDQGNAASWITSQLLTLAPVPAAEQSVAWYNLFRRVSKGDGNLYLGPYVTCEINDGLRGRLAKFFRSGATLVSSQTGDLAVTTGEAITYVAEGFVTVAPLRNGANNGPSCAFGKIGITNTGVAVDVGQVIAVPNGL